MIYLLDTNICIYLLKHRPPQVRQRFEKVAPGEVALSSITVAELSYGVERSQHPQQNRAALQQFLFPLVVVDFDEPAAVEYGKIRAALERAGTPIGPLDLLIAAHAVSLDSILVSNNLREFQRVPGLRTENWA